MAAEWPDVSFCDMTAHINESMDNVKRKRLNNVRYTKLCRLFVSSLWYCVVMKTAFSESDC